MKPMLLMAAIIASLSINAQPLKKANTIIIHSISFNEVSSTLLSHNYFFDKIDTSSQYLTTQPRTMGGGTFIFNVRVKDSVAYVSGIVNDHIKVLGIEPTYDEIKNWGMKGSLAQTQWKAMLTLAEYFNKPLEYQIIK